MNAYDIITAYQNSKKPHLKDTDLARLWDVSSSLVGKIKNGERRPGNEVWPNCQKNTPELYVALQKHYFDVTPEPHQTSQDGRGGWLNKLRVLFHL
jgi:hypothetical protein